MKIGSQQYPLGKNEQVRIVASAPFIVYALDDKEKVKSIIARSVDNEIKFTIFADANALIDIAEGEYWDIEIKGIKSPYEEVSDIPVEIPDEYKLPETLEEKMKKFLGQMVMERFGDNDQVESLEEAMDFDIDGDGEIGLSGYEVNDMVPEAPPPEPIPEPTPEPTPTPDPAPVEPVPK